VKLDTGLKADGLHLQPLSQEVQPSGWLLQKHRSLGLGVALGVATLLLFANVFAATASVAAAVLPPLPQANPGKHSHPLSHEVQPSGWLLHWHVITPAWLKGERAPTPSIVKLDTGLKADGLHLQPLSQEVQPSGWLLQKHRSLGLGVALGVATLLLFANAFASTASVTAAVLPPLPQPNPGKHSHPLSHEVQPSG